MEPRLLLPADAAAMLQIFLTYHAPTVKKWVGEDET